MSIRNILVAFNGSQNSKGAVRLARMMMQEFEAHLTGALTYGPNQIGSTLGPYATAEVTSLIVEAEETRRAAISDDFLTELGLKECDNIHWIENGGDVDFALIELARSFDIVVVGQYDTTGEDRKIVPHPDMIAYGSGRPVMVVPPGFDGQYASDKAVLAWDGGKSAARALADAIPELKSKSEVMIVNVGQGTADVVERLDRVSAHLRRHGIKNDFEIVPRTQRSIGKVLLETVDSLGAGLLVMGAYEHSKFAEDLWGGVTDVVLRKAHVPVLMSH